MNQIQTRVLRGTLMFGSLMVLVVLAHANVVVRAWGGPPAGTPISNMATSTYVDGTSGVLETTESNMVTTLVDSLESFALNADRTETVPAGAPVLFVHTLSNTGNSINTFILSLSNGLGDDYDLLNLRLDANGLSGTTGIVVLNAGESLDIQVRGDVPLTVLAGDSARVQIEALGQLSGGVETNIDTAVVVEAAVLQVVKIGGSSSAEPGTRLSYTVSASNPGAVSAFGFPVQVDGAPDTLVVISDRVPVNTAFITMDAITRGVVLYRLQGASLNDWVTLPPGNPAMVEEVAIGVPFISPGEVLDLRFSVLVGQSASGFLSNVAQATFIDGVTGVVTVVSNTVVTTLPVAPPGIAFYNDDFYDSPTAYCSVGSPLYVQAVSGSCNLNPTTLDSLMVTLTSVSTGDTETFLARESGVNTGYFRVVPEVPTQSADVFPVVPFNQVLETVRNDRITAQFIDCNSRLPVQSGLVMDPSGVVFDSRTGDPVAGARVSLIQLDGLSVSSVLGWVLTGPSGRIDLPLVDPGRYRLDVEPPADYRFPSSVPTYMQPPGRYVESGASYGVEFRVFENPGAVAMDIPLDSDQLGDLVVDKSGSKTFATFGDFVDYRVEVSNVSGAMLTAVVLEDQLPRGITYQPGSARVSGVRVEDPEGGGGPLLRFLLGPLPAATTLTVTYRALVGVGTPEGDAVNRAQAFSGGSLPQASNVAGHRVQVQGGVFTDSGYIVGRVFIPRAAKAAGKDSVQVGIPGVRILLEDGTFTVTDAGGAYSFYGVSPRTHVLKLDATTLPLGSRLLPGKNRDAGTPSIRFVDMKRGELQRYDFRVVDEDLVRQEVRRRLEAGSAFMDETESAVQSRLTQPDESWATVDGSSRPAAGFISGQAAGHPGARLGRELDSENSGVAQPPSQSIPPFPSSTELAGFGNQLGFVGLGDGDIVSRRQVNLVAKAPGSAGLTLSVNGVDISPERVGTRHVDPQRDFQVLEFVDVELLPGDNQLTLRLMDEFGNTREEVTIGVVAPDRLARLELIPERASGVADGQEEIAVEVRVADYAGTPVTARTFVTLETQVGVWWEDDASPAEPGLQVAVDGGSRVVYLRAPREPGQALLRAVSGRLQARAVVEFTPVLRPLLAAGLVEGFLTLTDVSRGALAPVDPGDDFEAELRNLSTTSDDGRWSAGGRASMFLTGKIKGEYLLTLAYDSEKDREASLFRDIQPDRFYPVYGSSSPRGFDGQSSGRLYVRMERDRSYLQHGDFVTGQADDRRNLGAYSRSLTGTKTEIRTDQFDGRAFASRTRFRSAVEELPAEGLSGPYQLTGIPILPNSEKVELITRDRNQPDLILRAVSQERFLDYTLEPREGRLLFRRPVASLDEQLNPISIRVTYEREGGGEAHWVGGVDGVWRVIPGLSVGGSYAADDNPAVATRIGSINLGLSFSENSALRGEWAASDAGTSGWGDARRLEFHHRGDRLSARVYGGETDTNFVNPSAGLSGGRVEAGGRTTLRLTPGTRFLGEYLYSEDRAGGGMRRGGQAAVEQSMGAGVTLEGAVRHAEETAQPRSSTSARAKLTAPVPGISRVSLYGEFERDLNDPNREVAAVGGEFRFAGRSRMYLRHEFLRGLSTPYALDVATRRHATVIGIDSDYMTDGHAFSEYRSSDVFSGREAEAAVGLRNRWKLSSRLRVDTSFERVHSIGGPGDRDATSVTGAVELLGYEAWKGTFRQEFRSGETARTHLNTLGVAYKLSNEWTLLARNAFRHVDPKGGAAGSQARNRLQVGMAYRDPVANAWNALGRYEFHFQSDELLVGEEQITASHEGSVHLNVQPRPDWAVSGRYTGRWTRSDMGELKSKVLLNLLSSRVTREFGESWDVSLLSSVFIGNRAHEVHHGFGIEAGRAVAANLWLSGGYNLFGFHSDGLERANYTQRGGYLRFRFKFDESLLPGASFGGGGQ